jgi:hypothetical protein
MAIFIIVAVITALYICLVCCMWKAIKLGAAIMETASGFISENKKVVVLPFLSYIFCFPVIVWWTATAIYIYGLGTPEYQPNSFVANVAADE